MITRLVPYKFWKDHNEFPMMKVDEVKFFKSYLDKSKIVFEYGSGKSTLYFSKLVNEYFSVEHKKAWFEKVVNKKHKNTKVYLEPSNVASYCEDLDKNSEKLLEKRFKENNPTKWKLKALKEPKKCMINFNNIQVADIFFSKDQYWSKVQMKVQKFPKDWRRVLLYKDWRDEAEWHTLINYINKPLELIQEYGKFDIVLIDGAAREFCAYRAKDLIKNDGLIFFHDFKRTEYWGVLNFFKIKKQVGSLALLEWK